MDNPNREGRMGKMPRRALSLAELAGRELRRVAKLTRERNRLQRALERARLRYTTYKRMANDELRRRGGA